MISKSPKDAMIYFLVLGVFSFTNAQIVFEEKVGTENPFNTLMPGNYASPAFTDIDNDGDQDAFFALEDGSIAYYKNVGTHEVPLFEKLTGNENPLHLANGIAYAGIAFADIDDDGDDDAFVSSVYAWIKYFKNTGTPQEAFYEQQTGENNPLNHYDEGFEAKLDFVDIDNDGDLDIFIGDDYGSIRFYKNEGTATDPVFVEQTGIDNPLDQVYVGDFVKPAFADLDNDGDYDLLLGVENGNFYYFQNIGTPELPEFTELTGNNNPFGSFNVGIESKPAFADLDGDGDLDLIAGNEDGDIRYFINKSILTNINPQENASSLQILARSENDIIHIFHSSNLLANQQARVKIYTADGRLIFSTVFAMEPTVDLKIQSLPSGIFLLQFQSGTMVKTMKFVI